VWGVTGRIVAKSKASTNDQATRAGSGKFGTENTSRPPVLPDRAASKVSTVLAEFRDRGSWDYTTVEAAARVSLLNGDDGELRIEVAPSSSEFKFFSEPHGAIVVTDKNGQLIASQTINELAMGMSSSVDRRHRAERAQVANQKFRNAAYAFFRLKFCAWQLGFDRTVKASNGCYRSSLNRELRTLTIDLPAKISDVNADIGRMFKLLDWQAVRFR
jgi:hypothetical protein